MLYKSRQRIICHQIKIASLKPAGDILDTTKMSLFDNTSNSILFGDKCYQNHAKESFVTR
jgi:hypothetical protein